MNNQELRDLCRRVVNRGKSTADEKTVIADECKARGIELNTRCPNCYVDAATLIYSQLVEEDGQGQAIEDDTRQYVLRPGVDILHNGVRLNVAIITDELAESMIANGLSLSFFAKHPQQ